MNRRRVTAAISNDRSESPIGCARYGGAVCARYIIFHCKKKRTCKIDCGAIVCPTTLYNAVNFDFVHVVYYYTIVRGAL